MTARPAEVSDDGTTLLLRREYPDPVHDVWAAITESERLGRWIGTWTGDPASGTVSFTMTGEVDAGGEVAEPVEVAIVVCEPPRRLVVDLPESPERSWHLDLTVEPAGTGATLTFAQRLVEGLSREDLEAGWTWYLDRLGASMHGEPMPPWSG